MITNSMRLNSMTDVRQWAGDIVERWEGDYEKNVSAMSRAIGELMPSWGVTKSEIDWDAVEKLTYEILNKNTGE